MGKKKKAKSKDMAIAKTQQQSFRAVHVPLRVGGAL
jgi:hypothetical protein